MGMFGEYPDYFCGGFVTTDITNSILFTQRMIHQFFIEQ